LDADNLFDARTFAIVAIFAPAKASALASTRWAERRDHAWDAAKLGPAGGALRKR